MQNQNKILCTGSLDHYVVADGIINFLHQNLPSIRKLHPDVKVTVLGRTPRPELKQCIEETAGVEHIDYVQDYADFLDQDWVYIYPQKAGSGLQTKMQQAMALGLPVVGYDVSFGGLSVESGKHCFICNSSNDMTSYVLGLVGDGDLRREIGLAAVKLVRENFSIKRVGSHMISLYHEAIAK
jgi:glycosyltransferase involved in cell wall biosynthesis